MGVRGWAAGLGVLLAASVVVTPPNANAVVAAPRVGQCYNYTFAQANTASASPTAAVSCSARHTAVTFYVGTVSGSTARSSTPTAAAVLLQVARVCNLRLSSSLGSTVRLTRAFPANQVFVPTVAQWSAGARFYRCDADLVSSNTSLAAIPSNFISVIKTSTGVSRYRWCLTARAATTSCTATHYYSAITWVSLVTATAPYPGAAVTARRAASLCAAAVSRLVNRRFAWYSLWPLSGNWAYGLRSATCFVH